MERDAATLHSVRAPDETALRRVDPRTVADPGCGEALDRLDRAGMSVGIWAMATDIGIPAFKCLIAEGDRQPVRMASVAEGMGCHPDPKVALLRALTEAAQVRLALISGARDEPVGWDDTRRMEPESLPGQELAGETVRDFTTVPAFDGDSFDADVAWELAALRSAGISEVVAVDLTREEFGIPVVPAHHPGAGRAGDDRSFMPPRPAGYGADQGQ